MLLGWTSGCASLPANTQRTASSAFNAPEQTALGRLVQERRAQANARSDSAFKLIDGVELAYTSRLALILGAQRSLDLQYYAIHADPSTETLLQAVRDAARRGVRVRILLDDFNSVGQDAQVLRLAFEPNVEIRLFNPLPGPRNNLVGRVIASLNDIPRIQKRMHNKLLLADNAWGITGGRNLGDRFFGTGDKINFVDLDVLAAGAVVRAMSASFDRFWNDELAYPVQTLMDPHDLEKLRALPGGGATADGSRTEPSLKPASSVPVSATATVLPSIPASEAAAARRPPLDLHTVPLVWAPSAFLEDEPGKIGPGDDEVDAGDTVVDGLLSLMGQAQRDVLIVSPYVVPGPRMMALYEKLRQRGVRIRMLTNSLASNDAPAAHAGYLRYRDGLLRIGVEIYEMRADPASVPELAGSGSGLGSGVGGSKGGQSRASLHSKAVIIDGRLAVIGSMNLDLRSQLKNSEVALVIRSTALCAEVARQVDATLASGAYRLERHGGGRVVWRAPPGAPFKDSRGEPEAGFKARLMVQLLGPFAPEEML
jgi:phosphatidylserine/phosphatidylglycerophosphate/cardiolipin synthase-like enzyme